jgi:hypothetical protein
MLRKISECLGISEDEALRRAITNHLENHEDIPKQPVRPMGRKTRGVMVWAELDGSREKLLKSFKERFTGMGDDKSALACLLDVALIEEERLARILMTVVRYRVKEGFEDHWPVMQDFMDRAADGLPAPVDPDNEGEAWKG